MSPLLFAIVAQQGRPVHPKTAPSLPAAVATKPVTAREAREALGRAATLLTKVSGRSLGACSIPSADRPASRSEIVGEMARLYTAAEPTFRFTPASVPFDPSKFKIDPARKAALSRLVLHGCVARIGPLATGPGPGLTPKEFGDALGFFMARLSQMGHLPSPKWTPILQGD